MFTRKDSYNDIVFQTVFFFVRSKFDYQYLMFKQPHNHTRNNQHAYPNRRILLLTYSSIIIHLNKQLLHS